MNIVLLEPHEVGRLLPLDDRRTLHILHVLRCGPGSSFDAGVIGGPLGKATVRAVTSEGLELGLELAEKPAPLHPLALLVGACRPVAAQRILRDATSLGVEAIWVCGTDRAEASYLRAALWRNHGYREHLIAGAEQAFSTLVPEVRVFASLEEAIAARPASGEDRIALDNYESTGPLTDWLPREARSLLAVGPERGWSAREREVLRSAGFSLLGLGKRVLRTETACLVGAALALARRGLL